MSPKFSEPTTKVSRTWTTSFKYTPEGKPTFNTETETVELTNFDEYFIHYLSDYLPTINISPDGDGLDRLQQFRELYVQTLLEAKHEYVKDCYSPP